MSRAPREPSERFLRPPAANEREPEGPVQRGGVGHRDEPAFEESGALLVAVLDAEEIGEVHVGRNECSLQRDRLTKLALCQVAAPETCLEIRELDPSIGAVGVLSKRRPSLFEGSFERGVDDPRRSGEHADRSEADGTRRIGEQGTQRADLYLRRRRVE
jgi:hypothetical protein